MLRAKPPDACREKLVLFWHNHLASGASKSPDFRYMAVQNALFRSLAAGNLKTLIREFNRDPANLHYIDGIYNYATNDASVDVPKVNANENFSRELMELHVLGIYELAADGSYDTTRPNYTEDDVHQLARALTGWNYIEKDKGMWNRELPHWDGGRCDDNNDGVADPVTIFGVTNNNFRIDDEVAGTADDVVELLFGRTDAAGNRVVAMFIARKLWSWFIYPYPAPNLKAFLEPLASAFVSANFELRPLLKMLFTHDEFYSDRAKSRAVKNPVDFVVQTLRVFGQTRAKTVGSTGESLGRAVESMGMQLFEPPSVAGWAGGLAWINSGTLLNRLEFASSVASSTDRRSAINLKKISGLDMRSTAADPAQVVTAILKHLELDRGPLALSDTERAELIAYASSKGATLDLATKDSDDVNVRLRGLIALALQTPAYMVF